MSIYRDVVLGTSCPKFVVVRVIQRLDPIGSRRYRTDKHATTKAVLLAPNCIGDRVVNVVQEDLTDAGTTLWSAADVVGQPAIVGLHACVTVFVLVRSWRLSKEDEVREERRNRVWVDDLGNNAVGEHVAITAIVVPVADTKIGVLEILERVLVLLAPCVEVIAVLRVKKLAVLNMAATRVGVGRDDDVVIVRSEHGVSCGELALCGH
ncbi:unannotated protein [freshwater metagenome]|uniref:Unannotated protein n=1 Tax=freshwater metagenome TaxID=449393 RepID=A0A6J6LF32_9ZZZZ